MQTDIEIIFQKCALIAELTKRMKEKNHSFGKTVLMKIIYLLQELHKVPCGYSFSLYTYGPFSSEVLSDLDYVEALKGVEIMNCNQMGFQINPGGENEKIRSLSREFLNAYDETLSKAIDEFGNKWAKDLELISTIVYCDRNTSEAHKGKFIQMVKAIKPRFTSKEIATEIEVLEDKGYIRKR